MATQALHIERPCPPPPPYSSKCPPLLTPDLHKRHGPGRGTAHTPIGQAYGVSLAECLQTHSTTCDSRPDLWKREEGTLHPDPSRRTIDRELNEHEMAL